MHMKAISHRASLPFSRVQYLVPMHDEVAKHSISEARKLLAVSGAVDSIAKELAGHNSVAVNTQYTHLPMETLAHAVKQLPRFHK